MTSPRDAWIKAEAEKVLGEFQNDERDWGDYNFEHGFEKGELVDYFYSQIDNELDENDVDKIIIEIIGPDANLERLQSIKSRKELPSISDLRFWALARGADETIFCFVPLLKDGEPIAWVIIRRSGPYSFEEYDLIGTFNSEAQMYEYFSANFD